MSFVFMGFRKGAERVKKNPSAGGAKEGPPVPGINAQNAGRGAATVRAMISGGD